MTPEQCREARRLLGITQRRLGRLIGLHPNHVGAFERRGYLPRSREGLPDWECEIRAALEQSGIMFVEDEGGPGMQLRKS